MKIEIDYDGSTAYCRLTEYHGHPEVFVNFYNADEYSQLYAISAFGSIIEHWKKERPK